MKIDKIKYRHKVMHGLEIVLIGNEQLEGESILIHFPDNKWVIIDSCVSNIYPDTPLPQMYLEMRGYTKDDDVSHIVCTHWHLDHIEGLPALLKKYKTAEFVYSKINNEYIRYFYNSLQIQLNITGRNISGETAQIYDECMLLVSQNHMDSHSAQAYSIIKQCDKFQLVALSPSDLDNDSFLRDIQRGTMNTSINTPNKTSLSLVLQNIKNHQEFLFGGDLQTNLRPPDTKDKVKQYKYYNSKCNHSCGKRKKTGWCGVSTTGIVHPQRVKYVKLAHHGSPNGYCAKLMSSSNTIGTISCFASSRLPNPQLLREYSKVFRKIYVTNKQKNSVIQSSSPLGKIRQLAMDIQIIDDIGIIESTLSRIGIKTRCYGNAYQFVYSRKRRNMMATAMRIKRVMREWR